MDIQISVQPTPNPNAVKFVTNATIVSGNTVSYNSPAECQDNPLAQALFQVDETIKELYFFDNYITVTQDGSADWSALIDKITTALQEKLPSHDPNFAAQAEQPAPEPASGAQTDLDVINAILNDTVRPALQNHGGDIQVLGFKDNVLSIHYQGACGSCPSAALGTLNAIRNILIDRYNPDIEVVME